MVVTSSAVGSGSKELRSDWPNIEGLELGTTKIDGQEQFLITEGL